jgi:hypothetical protein
VSQYFARFDTKLTFQAEPSIPGGRMTVFFKEERMRSVVLSLCILVLAVAATGEAQVPYVVGDHIADFTLNDAYGTPVSLYDYDNVVIWLVFWTDT